MWILGKNGLRASNEKTGATLRLDYGSDKLIRVKKNYKTIATFKTMADAQVFLCDTVKKWNEEQTNDKTAGI